MVRSQYPSFIFFAADLHGFTRINPTLILIRFEDFTSVPIRQDGRGSAFPIIYRAEGPAPGAGANTLSCSLFGDGPPGGAGAGCGIERSFSPGPVEGCGVEAGAPLFPAPVSDMGAAFFAEGFFFFFSARFPFFPGLP